MFERKSAMNNPSFNYDLNFKRSQKMGFTSYIEKFNGYTIYFNEDETKFALVTNQSEGSVYKIKVGWINDQILKSNRRSG